MQILNVADRSARENRDTERCRNCSNVSPEITVSDRSRGRKECFAPDLIVKSMKGSSPNLFTLLVHATWATKGSLRYEVYVNPY